MAHNLPCALASSVPPLFLSTFIIIPTLPYLYFLFKLNTLNASLAFLPNFSNNFLKYFFREIPSP